MGCHVGEAAAMVVVQVAFAGVNVLYKLAINDGMDMRVMVAYRFLFATAFVGPLACFLERNSRPAMTWRLLLHAFLCGLFGAFLSQNLYVSSMKLTSATFCSAMTNLIPAMTFIMAVMFRLESLGIQTIYGQAKVIGTIVGIGGAMILTFFKGPEMNPWSTNFHLFKTEPRSTGSLQEPGNRAMGSLLAVASCFSYAIWLILQAKMSKVYPCHYSSTALMCLMGSIQSLVFALCMQREWSQWRIGLDIRLLAASYAGIVTSGLMLIVITWCIRRKGPLYASVFNPLMLVIVAILGSLLLNEKLHLGSIIGAVLIIIGLYLVLWGKGREAARVNEIPIDKSLDVVIVRTTSNPEAVVLEQFDNTESERTQDSALLTELEEGRIRS